MNKAAQPPDSGLSLQLMTLAQEVFRAHQFNVKLVPGRDAIEGLLVAENALSIVGVVATDGVRTVSEIEPTASNYVVDLVKSADVGPKVWDVYLVILCTEATYDSHGAALFEINYNTRNIRRLVKAGISPTYEAVEDALRTFLPLRTMHDGILEDGITAFERELLNSGASPDDVMLVINSLKTQRVSS